MSNSTKKAILYIIKDCVLLEKLDEVLSLHVEMFSNIHFKNAFIKYIKNNYFDKFTDEELEEINYSKVIEYIYYFC